MSELFTDLASSTLASGVISGATSLTVQAGTGALYPSPTGGDFFTMFLFKKATGESEFVACTARSADVITCAATSRAYNAGDVAELRPSAAFFNSLTVTETAIQGGSYNYDDTDAGSVDAYLAELTPTLLSYVDGMPVVINPANNNSGGACTLDIDTLGTKSVLLMDGSNPGADQIVAGRPAVFYYNDNIFRLINPAGVDFTNISYKDISNVWGKQQYFAEATLTEGASIPWNLDAAQTATVTLAGNDTLANPTNMKAGATYILRVKQDATGSRTLAFGTLYKWPGGSVPVLTTAANAVDVLSFYSDGVSMIGTILEDVK